MNYEKKLQFTRTYDAVISRTFFIGKRKTISSLIQKSQFDHADADELIIPINSSLSCRTSTRCHLEAGIDAS